MADVDVGAVAPVEPASQDAPVPDSTPEQVTESPEGEAKAVPPERTFTQKELDEIVQKRAAQAARRAQREGRLEAERDYYKQQLERATQQPTPARPAGEPKPTDFHDYESFVAALTDWKVDQKLAGMQRENQATQQQRAAQEQAQTVKAKLSSGAEKYADFEEVALADDVPISHPMAAAIAESDIPADLAYYLGQHRDEAARIARLAPTQQVRELAKLEAKLSETPAPTRTPAPIVPNQAPATVAKDPSKMTDKEFNDWRRRQVAQRR